MPLVGQDPYGNVIRQAIERRAAQMRSVRGGEWGRIPPEMTAARKALQTREEGVRRFVEKRNRMQGG